MEQEQGVCGGGVDKKVEEYSEEGEEEEEEVQGRTTRAETIPPYRTPG